MNMFKDLEQLMNKEINEIYENKNSGMIRRKTFKTRMLKDGFQFCWRFPAMQFDSILYFYKVHIGI